MRSLGAGPAVIVASTSRAGSPVSQAVGDVATSFGARRRDHRARHLAAGAAR